jgi:hypothetical protein
MNVRLDVEQNQLVSVAVEVRFEREVGNPGERSGGICSAPCGSLKSFLGSGPDESALPHQALTPNLIRSWPVAALVRLTKSTLQGLTNPLIWTALAENSPGRSPG